MATGESAAALLGPLTGGLVGEALRRHGCRLLPVAAPATLLSHAAVVTYCLQQRPALLPLSPVRPPSHELIHESAATCA